MGITFTNNWKNISDKLRSTLRTEFKGALPVFINDEPISTGGQFIQLDLASTSLLQKLVGCEIREYTVTMNYVYQNPNIKKSSLDHVLRYVSRIEQLMQNNISLSLTDSTAAVNCRVESTTFEEGENSYLVSFDYKCQHVSGLSETVATTPALLNNFSMSFDGSNDYIDFGNDTSLQITGAISISCWIKTSNTSSTQYLVAKDDNTNRNFSLATESSTGKAWFTFFNSGVNKQVKSTNHNVCDDNWNHIVALFDPSTRKSAIYVNGTLSAESVDHSVTTIDNDTVNLEMGRRGNGVFYLNGNMDEVAIWDTALDGDAIKAIYNGGKPTDLMMDNGAYDEYTDNIKGYWRMGDGTLDDGNRPFNGLIGDEVNGTLGAELNPDANLDTDLSASTTGSHWTTGANWTVSDNKATRTSGGSVDAFQTSGSLLTEGVLYRVSFTISNRTSGDVRVVFGGKDALGNLNANGDYVAYAYQTTGTGDLKFEVPDNTFAGSISNISIKQVNGNAALMINMDASSIEEDTP